MCNARPHAEARQSEIDEGRERGLDGVERPDLAPGAAQDQGALDGRQDERRGAAGPGARHPRRHQRLFELALPGDEDGGGAGAERRMLEASYGAGMARYSISPTRSRTLCGPR
jgi:hypothetical protein